MKPQFWGHSLGICIKTPPILPLKFEDHQSSVKNRKKNQAEFKQEISRLMTSTSISHYKGLSGPIIKSYSRDFQKKHLFNEVH